ncbi:MAG TPA: MFS transporter [Chthoniobacterales bacterium]|jgi:MFS family permease|nr:MFS transporter [Chthoniobacterales bacterium]
MTTNNSPAKSGARVALGLLLAINLFNYIDRYVLAAVEPNIRAAFFAATDPNAMYRTGLLAPAFLFTYMIAAPILGFLADRFSRWLIVGVCVILWSFATAASGFAATFVALFATRIFVGIGEGGYGPAAPTILSDYFPIAKRGRIMAIFCGAIPVGSALGYVLGGIINHQLGWRWAFYLVAIPGILLGLFCFFQKDPRRLNQAVAAEKRGASLRDCLAVFRNRSFMINCAAQTAMTFALGGLAYWMAAYLIFRKQAPELATPIFGGITVVAGLLSTLLGGFVADRLQKRFSGSYFLVSGLGMLLAFPLCIAMLFAPFPLAWVFLFGSVFFVFLNTGPSNAALANVVAPKIRATAFAVNILIIHLFGDALSPPLLGAVAGHYDMTKAFLVVSAAMLISGTIWLFGMKYLAADTAAVEMAPNVGAA